MPDDKPQPGASIPAEIIEALDNLLESGSQFYVLPGPKRQWLFFYNGTVAKH